MKLRPNNVMEASKRGPIGPIRRLQGKNHNRRWDPKHRIRETGEATGQPTTLFPWFHRPSSQLFGFHAVLFILSCEFVFKGTILAARGYRSSSPFIDSFKNKNSIRDLNWEIGRRRNKNQAEATAWKCVERSSLRRLNKHFLILFSFNFSLFSFRLYF